MAKFKVVDWSRQPVGDIELADDVFAAAIKPSLHWTVVKWQQAKRRAGTHSTKTRAEVRGTGKKPYRQKGTGRARQGCTRSPLWRGGAIVFGPRPRDYDFDLPIKVRRGALRSTLSMLVRDQKLTIVKNFGEVGPKTRIVAERLKGLGIDRALLVDSTNESLRRGAHNLPNHKYLAAAGLNVEDLLNYGALVISEEAARAIEQRLLKK
jgi:large subunit ribosomal protein L4